jgi:hypothetical protein
VSDDAVADRPPVVRAADADRQAGVAFLQAAVGEGPPDLDEFGARASAAYAAVTTAELEALLADLPRDAAVETAAARTPETLSNVLGDIRPAGRS